GSCACPAALAGADLGILDCSLSRSLSDHVSVSTTPPPVGTAVEIRWFHEVLSLSWDGADHPYQPTGNAAHYFFLDSTNDTTKTNNYHYTYNVNIDYPQQVLPLLSNHDKNGTPYTVTGDNGQMPGSVNRWYQSKAKVCHGTSGSGVFKAGTDEYYGPT